MEMIVVEKAVKKTVAAKDKDLLHVVWEVTDVWFHTMILLAHFGLSVDDVLASQTQLAAVVTVTLSDGTQITFENITHLTSKNFV